MSQRSRDTAEAKEGEVGKKVLESYELDEFTSVKIVTGPSGLEYVVSSAELTPVEKEVIEEVKEWFIRSYPVDKLSPERISLALEDALKSLIKKRKYRKKVGKDSLPKLIYYVRRDLIGFGKLEPLLRDPNVEDIHVLGIGRPIYVWHVRYENIPTNVYFEDAEELDRHLQKLMITTGRYVSLSRPIIDGTLPMGYRVHVVHSVISELGTTITIRKYREVPFTIADLIRFGTIDPELVALIWLALENKRSIFIIGETAAGKSFPKDTLIPIRVNGAPRLVTARELYNIVNSREYRVGEHIIKDVSGIEVLGVDSNYKLRWMKVKRVIKHKDTRPLVKVRTNSSIIVTTKDHNFIKIDPETLELTAVKAEDLAVGDFIVNTVLDAEFNTDSRFDPEYAYLLGLWVGDGIVDTKSRYIGFANSDEELIKKFEELAKKYWHGSVYLVRDKRNNVMYLRVKSQKALADVSRLLLYRGKKAYTVRVPDEMMFSDKDVCRAFIAGMLDTDGSVTIRDRGLRRVTIEFSTRSLALANSLSFMLKRLRTLHTFKVRTTRGVPHYVIIVYDAYAKKLLDMVSDWSIKAKRYKDVVAEIVKSKKRSPNINIFPVGSYLRRVRTALGLSEKYVEEELGISSRYLYVYERNARKMSPENLKRLYEYYRRKAIEMRRVDVIAMLEKLRKLLYGDLFAEEVLAIEEVDPTNEWLYDLEVEDTHLFVIGQIGWRLNHNTTLLNAILTLVPINMKIVVVEEVRELRLHHPNVTYLVTREGIDTAGRVTLYDLVKSSMRQRPDYIVVGEVRGEEAYVLLQAISLGHGSACTMHAESPISAVKRLMAPPMNIPPYLVKLLDIIVHISRVKIGERVGRYVLSAAEVVDIDPETKEPKLNVIYRAYVDEALGTIRRGFLTLKDSVVLKKISEVRGLPTSSLLVKVRRRAEFLRKFVSREYRYDEVLRLITSYRD